MSRCVVALLLVLALVSATAAGAAVTTNDPAGTVVLDGAKIFPIVLAKGPPPSDDAFSEVVAAGVNFFKVGPATVPWTTADVDEAKVENRTAAAHGAYTWVNLSTLSLATAGSATDALLRDVVSALTTDAAAGAIGMWKGRDEPQWSNIPPASLQFAYCRSTGRGDPAWCAGEPVLDRDHLWVTIQAPRNAGLLQPYSAVTDVHGVDVYPVTGASPNGDLSQVGSWTSTLGSVTPSHAVWTTLQVCASGSVGASGFVLPTRAQERFMIYDAIVNGARSLAFYGGNDPDCWSATDSPRGWNWTFWDTVLKELVSEISAISPLAPALVNTGTTQVLSSSDPTTEVIGRAGNAGDLWVIAARRGAGTQQVTIGGLPASVTGGDVYVEGRSVSVANGSFTDAFDQWGVHVYHFVPQAAPPPPAPPSISGFAPAGGPAGTRVTLSGANLGGATAVAFGGVPAGFTVTSPTEIAAIVPDGAPTGPITVTTPAGAAATAASFAVTGPAPPPPPPTSPPPAGGGSAGQAVPADLRATLGAKTPSTIVGGTDDVAVTVVEAGGGASQVTLTISLPAGLALVGPPAYERGSGCSGATTIVCDLDFLGQNASTRVLLSIRATAPGEQRITASVGSREGDANPADNTAVLSVTVDSPPRVAQRAAPTRPARATQGPDRLVGTVHADSLRGLGGGDTLIGLGGNDVLDGGNGNDTLIGGKGRDVLYGRAGNDVLSARDGTRDRVVCGPGRDRVIADRVDSLTRDCERVVRR